MTGSLPSNAGQLLPEASLLRVAEGALGWLRAPGPDAVTASARGWGAVEWEAARWTTQVHGIAPLLHDRLEATGAAAALDPPLRVYLASQHELNGRRNRRMLELLAVILRAAGAAGVRVMPLKGALLMAHYYADPALRPAADLDLLVPSGADHRLKPILLELGFRHEARIARHDGFVFGSAAVRYEQGEHPDNPIRLEIHTGWRLEKWGLRYDTTADLWDGAAPVDFAGTPGMAPAPWALFQHLLVHAAEDLMAYRLRLVSVWDLAQAAARLEPGDWARLERAARDRHGERFLAAPLRMAARYLPEPVATPDCLARLLQATPAALAAFLDRSTLAELSFCRRATPAVAERLLWFRPGRERRGALLRMLFPGPGVVRDNFPRRRGLPAAYAAYAVQVLRLLFRRLLGRPRRAWTFRRSGGHPPGPAEE